MDYSTLGLLHENTIICAVEPDSGLSYLAITFVGSILPTTFLNNKGLSYGEMTSNSTARNWPAIPHYVQAMLMATTCETCEEAYQLVRNTGGTTGFNLMVCQTEGDEVGVVIETAGALVNIRGAEDEDQQLIYSTNFFHTHPQDGSADLISGQIDYWSKDVDMIKRRFQRDTITFEDADSLEKWKELVICPRDQFYRVELKKLYGTLDAITAIKLQSTPPLAVYGDQQSPEYTLCEALDMPYGITEPLKNRWGLRSLYSVVFIPREKNMYVAAGMQPAQAGRFLKINFETIAKAAALV
jgi:hypothetical protein